MGFMSHRGRLKLVVVALVVTVVVFQMTADMDILSPEGRGTAHPAMPLYGDSLLDSPTAKWNAHHCFLSGSSHSPLPLPEIGLACAITGSILDELRTLFGSNVSSLMNPRGPGPCLVSAAVGGSCHPYRESLHGCIVRQGYSRLASVLAHRCISGEYWRRLRSLSLIATPSAPPKRLYLPAPPTPVSLSPTQQHQICPGIGSESNNPSPYIPPEQRDVAPFGPPRICANGARHYPISFGTAKRNHWDELHGKVWDFHPIPLDERPPEGLHHQDEELYDALGALSYFSYTHARGGWECFRHHQLLAVGNVPYFIDLMAKPKHVQSNFPLDLMRSVITHPSLGHLGYVGGTLSGQKDTFAGFKVKPRRNHTGLVVADELLDNDTTALPLSDLPNHTAYFSIGPSKWFGLRSQVSFCSPFGSINWQLFNHTWYWDTLKAMKRYAYHNMTAEAVAAYVLKVMDVEHAKNVLILTDSVSDFLEVSIEIGLEGLGINTTVIGTDWSQPSRECLRVPQDIPEATTGQLHRAKEDTKAYMIHGLLYSIAFRKLRGRSRRVLNNWIVEKELANGTYDAVIIAQYGGGDPAPLDHYLRLVKGKVAVFHHMDSWFEPFGNSVDLAKKAYFFSREIRSDTC